MEADGLDESNLECNCIEAHDESSVLLVRGRCAYLTSCKHIMCESCASRAFSVGPLCPVCNTRLSDGEVQELLIGVPPSNVTKTLFQAAFQSTSWDSILHNSFEISSIAHELQMFIQNQLLQNLVTRKQKTCHQEKRIQELVNEKDKTSVQLKKALSENSSRIQELEYHVSMREKELCEIKEAYKEKLRKCDAWEKAYNKLKMQTEYSTDSSASLLSHMPGMKKSDKTLSRMSSVSAPINSVKQPSCVGDICNGLNIREKFSSRFSASVYPKEFNSSDEKFQKTNAINIRSWYNQCNPERENFSDHASISESNTHNPHSKANWNPNHNADVYESSNGAFFNLGEPKQQKKSSFFDNKK